MAILAAFGSESHYFLIHFTERPLFLCALSLKETPFFDAICHRKTPASEVLGGTRTSPLYVSAPSPGDLPVMPIGCQKAYMHHNFDGKKYRLVGPFEKKIGYKFASSLA